MMGEKKAGVVFSYFCIYPGTGCSGTSIKWEFVIRLLVLPLFGRKYNLFGIFLRINGPLPPFRPFSIFISTRPCCPMFGLQVC